MTMPKLYDNSNPQLKLAFNYVQYTNQNIFLTGKAGTGKTTFLKTLKENSPKRMVVVAPTGVAAINAGGVTIHSFFQLPFGPQVPQMSGTDNRFNNSSGAGNKGPAFRFSKNKINLIRSLNLLVIDEISMVRADVLDAIDATLRRFRNRHLPFGGIQLLMIGDLQQLAPVVKDDEWVILKNFYDTCFFFSSRALKQSNFVGIELQHIYRQSEQSFIDLLNKVRDNNLMHEDLQALNNRYKPGFSPRDDEGYISLTTHNYQAKLINDLQLNKLPGTVQKFHCTIEDEFPAISYPADEVLEVKPGSQVMFLKNDPSPEKRYFNGKIGKVINIAEGEIEVLCPGDAESIFVSSATWENTKYRLNETTGEIEEQVVGKFIQYPLKLAWAITIHKSQGLTFEKAIIDARQSFAHGQVYVALSRCKSLEGLVLSTPLNEQSVINDNTVTGFINDVEQNQPDEEKLRIHRKEYELQILNELFDFSLILRNIAYITNYWNENETVLLGNLNMNLQEFLKDFKQEITAVAIKFRPQLEKLAHKPIFAEDNTELQDRLKKAAKYFLDKLIDLNETHLKHSAFETDNKAILKRLAEMQEVLETEIEIKKASLQSVAKGFQVNRFLTERAVAAIEKPAVKARTQAAGIKLTHPDFYSKIVQWRSNKAAETGLDEGKILLRRVMVEISENLPSTALELKAIKGMGGKKMEQFGQDLLSLLLNYRNEKGMTLPLNAEEEIALAGLDTKEISLVLFRQGMKVPEIAKRRNFAVSTIETHLSHFISAGRLDVFELIDTDKYGNIARCIKEKSESDTITEMKNKLGEGYSYGEIRIVMAHLNQTAVK